MYKAYTISISNNLSLEETKKAVVALALKLESESPFTLFQFRPYWVVDNVFNFSFEFELNRKEYIVFGSVHIAESEIIMHACVPKEFDSQMIRVKEKIRQILKERTSAIPHPV